MKLLKAEMGCWTTPAGLLPSHRDSWRNLLASPAAEPHLQLLADVGVPLLGSRQVPLQLLHLLPQLGKLFLQHEQQTEAHTAPPWAGNQVKFSAGSSRKQEVLGSSGHVCHATSYFYCGADLQLSILRCHLLRQH